MKALKLGGDYFRKDIHDIFSPHSAFTPKAGKWGISGIVTIPNRDNDFVFFVTYGQSQGNHEFDEGITNDGVLSWQSQPRQKLSDPMIQTLINHDDSVNLIHLLLREKGGADFPYTYFGELKFLRHDTSREEPVYFQWQLKQWNDLINIKDTIVTTEETKDIEENELAQDSLVLNNNPVFPPQIQQKEVSTDEFRTRKSPDYDNIERLNRKIGKAGEKLALKFEENRLRREGLSDLVGRIKHVSENEGDGAGYDIESFNENGSARFIEVKTTRGSINTGFIISRNEVKRSNITENYYLYRIYNFDLDRNSGELYIKSGPIENSFDLIHDTFKAKPSR